MSSEWEKIKLEEALEFYNGKKRPKSHGLIPVYGGNGILDYCDDFNTEGTNLIIGRVGAYCGNVNHVYGRCWISDNAILTKVKDGFDSNFMYHSLTNLKLNNYHIGSTQPLLTQGILKSLEVTIPSLEEQKSIAHILSTLDEKIETNNHINKKLEEMAQAIFKHWFVNFEFPNENGEPYKSSGGEMVESELGMIPKEWQVDDIYSIADIIYGAPFKSKVFNEEGRGLPLIRIRDLKTFTPQFYTTEIHKNAAIIEAGDVLVGMDAEFKPTIWIGESSYLNQRVCQIKSKKSYVHDYFLYELIKPYMEFFEFSKVGTTVIHLGKKDFDSIKIIKPNASLLNEFSKIVQPIHQMIVKLAKENITLTNLRDTLLPKLMSGEIHVPLEDGDIS